MLVKVSKEFRWEMGHRLPYHETCRNIHGHSYRMVVEVEGKLDDHGMVIDYGEITCVVAPIVKQMDHSFMVDPSDETMLDVLRASGLRATYVPFYSTAENIAQWVLDQVAADLFTRDNVVRIKVQVFETSNSCAEAERTR